MRGPARVELRRRARAGLGLLGVPVVFVAFWSSGYLVGNIGTRAAEPLTLLFWRMALALTVLTGISLVTRAPWPRGRRAWAHLAATGVLLQTVQFSAVYLALDRGTSAGLAALVVSSSPLVISVVAARVFEEHLSRRQWLGLLVGLAGVAAAVSAEISGGGGWAGIGLVVVGAAGFVAGTLYQKRFGQSMDVRTGGAVQLLGATAGSAVLAALHGGFGLPLTGPAVGSVVFLAVVNSIMAFTFFFWLLRNRGGGAATSYLFLVPPATALLGVPVLGQPVSVGSMAGIAVAAVGVAMVTWRVRPPESREASGGGGHSG